MDQKETDLLVLGGGPGGYAAAFYAAQRGISVAIVEESAHLGGVCLHRGCIPSKALLTATELIEETELSRERGIRFSSPDINADQLRRWKNSIVSHLAEGLDGLAERRKVEHLTGRGFFESDHQLRIESPDGQQYLTFERAIIATGSHPLIPAPFDLGSSRILTSNEALELENIPERLLVIGAGYIGMELGSIYHRLGSRVTLVETDSRILPEADADLAEVVQKTAQQQFESLQTNSTITKLETAETELRATIETDDDSSTSAFDAALVAVGRQPNTEQLGLEHAGIETDDHGFIQTDHTGLTPRRHIAAIGDVAGEPMLAHKATREAHHAVEALLGNPGPTNDNYIPAVIYTSPELAWCGLTESAKDDRPIKKATFPWEASGRALTCARPNGLTKLLYDPTSHRLLGVGIAGHGAAELIATAATALEMAASIEDIAETVYPHPSLSETIGEAARRVFGKSSHVL